MTNLLINRAIFLCDSTDLFKGGECFNAMFNLSLLESLSETNVFQLF
ncbi:hypothetical protein SHDE107825_02675 [Shewanella denitrificans]